MKRFVLTALVAVAMTLAGGQAARAGGCGWATVPGHIGMSGGIGLSWGSFGAYKFEGSGCNSSHCGIATVPGHVNLNGHFHMNWGAFGFHKLEQGQAPMPYGYGYGHGYGYGYGYHGYYGY